jgi:hypothetical protein
MWNDPDLPDQWELVARRSHYGWGSAVFELLTNMIWGLLGGGGPERLLSRPVTWTIRHKSSGETRTVTASSANEAATKINNGEFDSRPTPAPP